MTPQLIPVGDIAPSALNPPGRLNPEEPGLQSLLQSIREYGVREPPSVYRDHKAGQFVLISGHRRWFCATRCGHKELLCVVTDPPANPGEELLRQAIVNIHRQQYTPLELARLCRGLMGEFHLAGKEVAARLHVSPALVSTHLALLKLDEAHQQLIEQGKVSLSVGALMAQTEDPGLRNRLAEMAAGGASRKEVVAAMQKNRALPKRLSLRTGVLTVSAVETLPLPKLIRGLEELLKQARKAAEAGRGLETLTTPSPNAETTP